MFLRSSKTADSRHCSGLTCAEILAALFIVTVVLTVFAAFLLWAAPRAFGHNGMTATLSNMRQLHIATQLMAEDGVADGDKSLGWPGDTAGTFTNWARRLVPAYLGTNDFCKLLSAPGKTLSPYRLPESMSESAMLVYAIRSNSSQNAVFLTSANFTNSAAGGLPLQKSAKPYGTRGFVVFRNGGDGAILLKNQTGKTNLIGTFVPLLK